MGIQVLDRAFRITRVVARLGSVGLTAIAHETGLPLQTVSRIVDSLEEHGILARSGRRELILGTRLYLLGRPIESYGKFLRRIHPHLESLVERTGEDAGFAVLQGAEAVVVDWCHGPNPPNVIEPYARAIPLHCAFGKVLLAYQPERRLERYLRRAVLQRFTENTVVSREVLLEQIVRIRHEGLYLSRCENMDGAGSLSAPLLDESSRLLGALFVTGPLSRMSDATVERFRTALRETLHEIHLDTLIRSGNENLY